MTDFQPELLRWAADQPLLTGLLVFVTGLVCAFFGSRLFAFLVAVGSAALGAFVGALLAALLDLRPDFPAGIAAIACGGLSLKFPRTATGAVTGVTWGLLGYYLGTRLGLAPALTLGAGGLAGLLGVAFACLCFRTTKMVLTTQQGVVLLVLGFETLATQLVPAIGETFRHWANGQTLLLPVFLAMLFATGYSYQAMHQQGDIRTGK